MYTALSTTTDLQKAPTRLAILPIGATEQHSHHLPLATDSIVIETIGLGVAKALNAYCLPTLPLSASHMHRGCRGTVWLRNSTLQMVVRDIAASVRHEGFTQLVLLNGHGGNFILMAAVQDLNMEFPDLLTMCVDPFERMAESGIFPHLKGMSHGDEMETSSLLHLRPETVRLKLAVDPKVEPDREMLRYLPFKEFSKWTHSGVPTKSSAAQGRRAIEFMISHCVKTIRNSIRKVGSRQKK